MQAKHNPGSPKEYLGLRQPGELRRNSDGLRPERPRTALEPIQRGLSAIETWRERWNIKVNEDKTQVIYEGESNKNRKLFFKFSLLNESGTQLDHFST
jgi:hypothetical protein